MSWIPIALLTLGFGPPAEWQDDAPKTGLRQPKKTVARPAENAAPVTNSEVRQVFARARTVVSQVINKPLPKTQFADTKVPAAREAVVAEYARFLSDLSPYFKTIPNPIQFDATRFRLGSPTAMSQAKQLVQIGAAAPFGPLVSGPAKGLSPQEFGDSLGYFLARMAQLTHKPLGKWTPALGAGAGVEN